MASRLTIPPVANEDKLPHEKAVWREPPYPRDAAGHLQVTVDYGSGTREQCLAAHASWHAVTRWRFGWAPRKDVAA